jgi:hypothetical protein
MSDELEAGKGSSQLLATPLFHSAAFGFNTLLQRARSPARLRIRGHVHAFSSSTDIVRSNQPGAA